MNLRFNETTYTDIYEYNKALFEHCSKEKNCKYFYGEINQCMFDETDTYDKSNCKCDIDKIFK